MGIAAHMNDPSWNYHRGDRVLGPTSWETTNFKRGVTTLSAVVGVLFTFYVWKPSKTFLGNILASTIPTLTSQVLSNQVLYGDDNPFFYDTRHWYLPGESTI